MKNLLILISFLLLSPFLTSCEKNVEVVVEKKPILFRDTPYSKFVEGGKKWFKTGDEKTQVKFEGDILNDSDLNLIFRKGHIPHGASLIRRTCLMNVMKNNHTRITLLNITKYIFLHFYL